MTTITLNVTKDLSDRDLDDIAITAIEGGIGYWSKVDLDRPWRTTEEDANGDRVWYLGAPIYVLEDDVEPELADGPTPLRDAVEAAPADWSDIASKWTSDADEATWVLVGRVDRETIAKGIQWILEGGKIRSDLEAQVRTVLTDDIDIDADAADCLVQAGLFGSIVYG